MSERWATFDCYGTLADWVGGMTRAVHAVAGDETPRVIEAYFDIEPEVEGANPGTRYREILAETLRRAADRAGVALAPGDDQVLGRAWAAMDVFADVRPALGALRDAGWRLAILSNCDDDLLARTVAEIAVPFDELVTAEQVGSYKPAHGHFREFARRTDGRRADWVHCANSAFYDMAPAAELGIPFVWIDRDRTGHDDSVAWAHLHGMAELPAVLTSRSGS